MKKATLIGGMFCLILATALAFSGRLVTAQSLAQADRQRIENYGALFVRAINADASEAQTKAVPEVFAQGFIQSTSEARLAGLFARLRQQFGEMEYHHSELLETRMGERISRILHIYAKAKGAKMWQDIQCRIEDSPPHKIKELAFIAEVAEPIALPNGEITDRNTLDWLNNYVDKLIADNDLAGSILIAQGDRVIYERAFGFADAKRTSKVMPETRFGMASGSKMFTALAIAQLVEKGKLSYSDPLSKFFPDFPNAAFAKKATIHNLLSHTSGVNEYWTPEYEKSWKTILTNKQMLPWVYKVGADFEPGAKFHYSNSNFILAGLIVEQVGGMDYYDYVRKHITGPLGMTMTDFYLRDGKAANLAEPLKRGASGWEFVELGARGTAAGGCFSTPREMLKFARGLTGGKLVTKETLTRMSTTKVRGLDAQMDYGYGFELGNQGQVFSFGHGGIARGTNFEFRYFPADDITLIAFNNQNNGAYDDLRGNIVKLITGWR
jgi:CubicO group peptidase (beta-lactamase class C family)